MIFGAKEEIIPKYYDDDKPKGVQKTAFGLIRIILLWLINKNNYDLVRRSRFGCAVRLLKRSKYELQHNQQR